MAKSKHQPKYSKKKARSTARLFPVLVLILLLIGIAFLGKFFIFDNVRTDITIEVGESIAAGDFLLRNIPLPLEWETDLGKLDLSVPGDHQVHIRYCLISFSCNLHVRDTVAPVAACRDLTVLSIHPPKAEDFITDIHDLTEVTTAYCPVPDLTREGSQTVTIALTDLGGNTTYLNPNLNIIIDRSCPEISGVQDYTVYVGQDYDPMSGITVSDDLDEDPTVTLDDGGLDVTEEGIYTLVYRAVDESGNEAEVSSLVTVILDNQAPTMYGIRPLSVYAEGTISYRSNVILTDDKDPSPVLTIDSSQVDLTTPGTYPVIYTATDAAGNSVSTETTITVGEKPDTLVDTDTIYTKADEILAQIITEDMTPRQQVKAIYVWVLNNCWYTNHTDKTDWLQTAYHMMTKGNGDCFGFYSVSRLMFERLGIPNMTVQRKPNNTRRTTHYWSLVSVDGGETYYHFDSCPHPQPGYAMCLVTDAVLQWFNGHNPYYYYFDHSLYPATPKE